ncbi:Periplasmic aromatic aldehyde oxidoreductase, molybdenum binding subunit YagR [Serinicoccus hydrothermalis]|uniref:Periplasmic aromatic aldehyde oxidoreductase, molybdenum binding subunit YagR n=1 Tax=Serinicoccus hydrothermalis TaxID=1758689 RepID=A0A1B1NDA7_9MICO|nr:xanthine dehydrogenase family protein molybdopterin-binding subunit [Serinicoccus hydrothermalis]ANS79428.1 Periplasmic aromatic aldehyde oxidoreductase, molybdenum binding subunit YagR [Serinicoccus hydrothermalis]
MSDAATEQGRDRARVDGPLKVAGLAPYAYEHEVGEALFLAPVLSTVATGEITGIDTDAARAVPGVHLVLTHDNAPRLALPTLPTLAVLRKPRVRYRGEIVAAVVADTLEAARHAASLVQVGYAPGEADVRVDQHGRDVRSVRRVMGVYPGQHAVGDVDAALAGAAYRVEGDYATPVNHHNPIEPHSAVALWHEGVGRLAGPRTTRLTLWDSNQGVVAPQGVLAGAFGLLPTQVEVISPYVGGSFGTKGMPHPHLVVTVMAARMLPGRAVKVALTRPQMFSGTGYRPETRQRVTLAADEQGRLQAVDHEVFAPVSRVIPWLDPTAGPSLSMYASTTRRVGYRAQHLDIAPGTFMRAPGEYTGMFALESAMDELARDSGIDPIELRLRNEPETDPESGKPWSSRHVTTCLTEGARVFGFEQQQEPGGRREGEWLLGMGVACASFPQMGMGPSLARITFTGGRYVVSMQASDIGTGAWTVLAQIAAQALDVPQDQVEAQIGRSDAPYAIIAGGSTGTFGWGSAVVEAAVAFREEHGSDPAEGATARARGRMPKGVRGVTRMAFGAHFAEVAVSEVSGEVRVRRLYGHFDGGRIMNPRTARSQLVGGMTMGLSGALFEESYRDPRFGHVVNADLAGYHVAAHADVVDVEVGWIGEPDPWMGATGAKGIGEVGIVGVPAAIGNAIFDATGLRLRELPFTPGRVLEAWDGASVAGARA